MRLTPLTSLVLLLGCGAPSTAGTEPPPPPPTEHSTQPATGPASEPDEEEEDLPGPAVSQSPTSRCRGFTLTGEEAGCPPLARGDCSSRLEVRLDGTLVLDAWGDPGGGDITVTQALDANALQLAWDVLCAPELVRAMSAPCDHPDATEHMRIDIGNGPFEADTGACNTDPIMAARGKALELVGAHFPDHHLISPPF